MIVVGFFFFGDSSLSEPPPSSLDEIFRFFFSAWTGLADPEREPDLDRDLDLDVLREPREAGEPLRDLELEEEICVNILITKENHPSYPDLDLFEAFE